MSRHREERTEDVPTFTVTCHSDTESSVGVGSLEMVDVDEGMGATEEVALENCLMASRGKPESPSRVPGRGRATHSEARVAVRMA